jgi:hypothetical protein
MIRIRCLVFIGAFANSICFCCLSFAQDYIPKTTSLDFTGDLIYQYRLQISADGTASEYVTGSRIVVLDDGSEFIISSNDLVDPDGDEYVVVGDAYQNSESGPVVYLVSIFKSAPDYLSEYEILNNYYEIYPSATFSDVDSFLDRRAHRQSIPEKVLFIEPAIEEWYAIPENSTISVVIVFKEQPALDLPLLSYDVLETDPIFWLDQYEARVLAIEDRKTEIENLQDQFAADITALGAQDLMPFWLINAIEVTITRDVFDYLIGDNSIARIELSDPGTLTTNMGDELRDAMQINQFLAQGYNGELPSGRNETGDMFVAVVDQCFDSDHPVWKDGLYSNPATRLEDVYCYYNGAWTDSASTCASTYSCWGNTGQHGTKVAGQLVGDLTQYQDSNYSGYDTQDQRDRTGFATEAALVFIDTQGVSNALAIQKAVELDVDVANYSIIHTGGTICDTNHSYNTEVDNAMHSGIFWAQAAGNEYDPNTDCQLWPPSTASGAFVVASYDKAVADLNAGSICSTSGRGDHPALDYTMVDVTTAGGREGATTPDYNNNYITSGNCCTSYATPAAAGAAIDLKHHFMTIFDSADVNDVGLLYASMLVMTDGQLESGGKAVASTPNDPRWGAGRLRMRLLNASGMDSPWRFRYFIGTLDDGQTRTIPLNPDDYGVNQDVPEDAEWFKAALWYHEPNIGSGETPAEIKLSVCDSGGCYNCSSMGPQRQRLWLGNVVGDETWAVKIQGIDVTASTDESDPYYDDTIRKVYLAFYWEDNDWDDQDGPSTPQH